MTRDEGSRGSRRVQEKKQRILLASPERGQAATRGHDYKVDPILLVCHTHVEELVTKERTRYQRGRESCKGLPPSIFSFASTDSFSALEDDEVRRGGVELCCAREVVPR